MTQVANAREKAKDSRERRRKGRHTDKTRRGRARGEDKNVDWPQIESRPFITLHLCPHRPLRSVVSFGSFGTTVNKNRNGPRSILSLPSSPSLLFRRRSCFPPPSPSSFVTSVAVRGREFDSQNGWTEFLAEKAIRTSSWTYVGYKLYVPEVYTPAAGWKSFLAVRGHSRRFTGM